MTNEEKAARLEEIAQYYLRIGDKDAALLREAAQLFRERGTLLTRPDWKTMYEAQERDMEALRKRVGELEADLATAGSNVHTLRDELQEAQQQMAADAMLIAEAQRGAEIVADTERRLESRIADLEAERDAAKAGEARAVEALRKLHSAASYVAEECNEDDWTVDQQAMLDLHEALDAVDVEEPQPALDWLAQQRREAAARELRLLADGCATVNPVLSWQLRACADGLTDQTDTACSRSKGRGEENDNA